MHNWSSNFMSRLRDIAICVVAWQAAGCGDPPVKKVDNPDPLGKIPAIKEAVRERDYHVIPQLIHGLDDSDSAVRLYSIQGLQRLTGKTFGYRFYDDETQRAPAIQQWQQWLAQQK